MGMAMGAVTVARITREGEEEEEEEEVAGKREEATEAEVRLDRGAGGA